MDIFSKNKRSLIMRSIKSVDTGPDIKVGNILNKIGYKSERYVEAIPGKPDFSFPSLKKVIFVHGCYWHQHKGCRHAHMPKTNRSYWAGKLLGNVRRDKIVKRQLTKIGWKYYVIWECWLKDEDEVAVQIINYLEC